METKFNSQICTTREQSERLLALGLKKETADMCWTQEEDGWGELQWYCRVGTFTQKDAEIGCFDYIPAWSLRRLIKMMPQIIGHLELAVNDEFVGYYEDRCESETGMYWEHIEESSNLYDNIISTIEWLIKEGYFKKEMSTTHKIKTSMRGFKQWMDAHPRKNLTGYFSIDGRDMTNAEIRKMVSYAVANGYETEADIPSEELASLLKLED